MIAVAGVPGEAKLPAPTSLIALPHLRGWRLHALLRRNELARKAGVSARTVERAELGGKVSDVTSIKLARALGISVSQLLNEEPPL
jgi:transcriptional regulator with XRE-family HTH domain